MTDLRTAAQQALEALEMSRRFVYADSRPQCDDAIDALRAALAQQAEPKGGGNLPPPLQAERVQEPDLSRCPQCGGPADNGHDRSIPPNPYLCTRCMAEPVHKCPNCASLEAQNTELDRKLAEVEQEEREECAKLAEATICDTHLPTGVRIYGTRVADAIRARSNP